MTDWPRTALREVMRLDVERVAIQPNTRYPIVGVLNRGRGLLRREAILGSQTKYATLNRVRPGRVIYSRLKAFEGAATVATDISDDAFASQEFPTFTCGSELLPRFFRLVTTLESFWSALSAQSKGMGGRRERVSPDDFLNLSIDLPGLDEQRRIVDIIGALDTQIRETRFEFHSIDNVKRLALDRMFESGVGDHLVGEIIELIYGEALPARSRQTGDVKVFGAAGITGTHIQSNLGPERPIVVGRKGADARATVAIPIRIDDGLPDGLYRGWGGAGSVRWCSEPHWVIDTAYSVRALMDLDPRLVYWLLVRLDLPRVTTQTTLPGLSREVVYKLPASLPLQPDLWLDLLDGADACQAALLREEASLRALRTELLNSLLSGEVEMSREYDSLLAEVV